MRITGDMLIFCLEHADPSFSGMLQYDASKNADSVNKIIVWDGDPNLLGDVLYIVKKEFENAFSEISKNGDRYQSVRISSDHLSADKALELLSLQRIRLLEWNMNLVEGILDKREPEELFRSINHMIDRDFAIVNMDMQYVFCTDGYAKSRSLTGNKRMPQTLFQDLVTRKDFHKAALEKGIFYYYTDAVETMDLCYNIFAKDQYVARIVLTLLPGEMSMPKGAEEIFETYARHMQELFSYANILREKSAKGEMQELCRQLLKGDQVDPTMIQDTLADFNWKQRDTYQTILLKFNTESGWNAQLYMMLPYLCTVLESEWPGCFTSHSDTEILLVLNLSYEGYGQQKAEKKVDLQKLAYFVRENSCKAGVSPVFKDLLELKNAYTAAKAALTIGMQQKPHLGYYLFDDVRLSYLMNCMKGDLSETMLIHPALSILAEYDAIHKSELNRTLSVYLKNNLNMTAASEELFIHRTSFCRRMNQIRKLTNVNLEDPDIVLTLLLSYRMENGYTMEQ